MESQYSWKRTEDTEIDLTDLLYRLCVQWKRIAVCALAFALVFGGAGWLDARRSMAETETITAEEAELTETEEQAVTDAVRLRHEISGLETYLDSSVLMQLDPYHKNRYVMFYSITHAKRQELPVITESYLNFLLNGGAADRLLEAESGRKMDKSCLAELISAYQKTYSTPYQIAVDNSADSSQMAESIFYTEITGRNAKEAEKMAKDLQEILQEYSAWVKTNAGSHRLALVSGMSSVTSDSGLLSQQRDKKAQLSANRTSLKTTVDSFSKEQEAVFWESVGEEESGLKENGEIPGDGSEAQNDVRSGIKYAVLGLFAGIFIYCGVYACWYLFGDMVRNTDEMKRMYTFPVYGGIAVLPYHSGNGTGNLHGLLHEKNGRMPFGRHSGTYGNTQEQVLNRIRLACGKQGMKKLCAAADFSLNAGERKFLENLAEMLRDWEIDLSVAENAGADSAVWDSLAENGNVLMVCRMGWTTHRMIDDAMSFYLENGVHVTGALAFA